MSLDVARRITNKQNMLSQRTLTFIIVIIFLMSIGEGAVTPAIPLHGAALGASYKQLGFFMTGYSIAYMLMTITAGMISDLIGRKWVLLMSIVLSAIASMGYCYASTSVAMLCFRTMEGASRGILWPIAEAIVADNTTVDYRSKVMGRFTGAYGLGSVIGTLCGGYIMEYFNVGAVFPIYPFICVVVVGAILYGITDKESVHHAHHSSTKIAKGVDIIGEIKTIWPVCLAGFAYAGFLYSILGLLPRIADHAGAYLQQIGYILALFWAARLVAFIACGEITAHAGRKTVLLTGLGFVIITTIILFIASDPKMLMIAAVVGGIGSGTLFTIVVILIADLINPFCLGFGMGFLEFCMGIGMVMQTTLAGITGEILGINYTFLFVFIVAVVALIFAFVFLHLPPRL